MRCGNGVKPNNNKHLSYGNQFSHRFPFIAMAVGKLPVRFCLMDGEASFAENGIAVFHFIRRHGALASVRVQLARIELANSDR
jgi:hypothetical protein